MAPKKRCEGRPGYEATRLPGNIYLDVLTAKEDYFMFHEKEIGIVIGLCRCLRSESDLLH